MGTADRRPKSQVIDDVCLEWQILYWSWELFVGGEADDKDGKDGARVKTINSVLAGFCSKEDYYERDC